MDTRHETRRTAPGPELRALYITRWWLMATLTGVLAGLVALVAIARWPQLNTVEHVSVLVALPTAAAGIALRRRPGSEWLLVASLSLFALAALVAPPGSPPWLPLPNSASYPVFLAIVLCSRRVGLALALSLPLIILAIWSDRPTNVIAGALLIGDGWIALTQALATSMCTWWVWNLLVRESTEADQVALDQERRTARSLVLLERARMWRAAAASVHESVLNSIRYVLGAAVLDRQQLARELDRELLPPDGTPRRAGVDRLLREVAADPLFPGSISVAGTCPDAEVEPGVYSAARNALVSLARTAAERRGAPVIELRAREGRGGTVEVLLAARRSEGAPDTEPVPPLAPALVDGLTEAGGSVAVIDGSPVIALPVGSAAASERSRGYEPFDKGRLLVTAVLAGSVAVGIAYLAILFATYDEARTSLAAAVGLAGCLTAIVTVVRRKRLAPWVGFVAVLAPAAVPWLLVGAQTACLDTPTIAPVVNVAGFSAVIVAAWSGRLPGTLGVLAWAAGAAVTAASFPAGCREAPMLALLNSLLLVPVVLQVTYAGVRTYERAAHKLAEVRRRELVGSAAAQTAIDLNATLYGSVGEAVGLLGAVAAGSAVDEGMRRDLRVVDARIRAAMQVDPVSAGAFASLAKTLVEVAAAEGVPVEVRALAGSGDQRPVPQELASILTAAVTSSRLVEPVIQVFSDGTFDYLTLMVASGSQLPMGLGPGQSVEAHSAVLNLLEDEEGDSGSPTRVSIVLTRPVLTANEGIPVP